MVKKIMLPMVFMLLGNILCIPARGSEPNAYEMVRLYHDANSNFKVVSMKLELTTLTLPTASSEPNYHSRHTEFHIIYHRDGNRMEWLEDLLPLDKDGNISSGGGRIDYKIFPGDQFVIVVGNIGKPPLMAQITRNFVEDQKSAFDSVLQGGPLFGHILDNSHKSIAELLSDSNDLHLRPATEIIDGVSCYVLEAKTKYGKVTAWIAPEKGYNAMKWIVEKGPSDFFDGVQGASLPEPIENQTSTFDSVVVEKISDQFIPISGRYLKSINYKGNKPPVNGLYLYKRSEIVLNPDFEALGAFKVNLPNGTEVHDKDHPTIRYIWQDGKIVPEPNNPSRP